MSKRMKVTFASLLAAIVAVLGFALTGSATGPVSAMPASSTGADSWSTSTQQAGLNSLGRIQLVVVEDVCKTQLYGDGAGWHTACNQRDYSGGSTWTSLRRKVWNIPLEHGGHSDVINYAQWHVGTVEETSENITDNETAIQNTDRGSGSGSTVWVEVKNSGTTGWAKNACRRTFFSAAGGTSTTNC